MNLNDIRLNAYKKARGDSGEKKESGNLENSVKSISKEIRSSDQGGKAPVVYKPVFEKINRTLDKALAGTAPVPVSTPMQVKKTKKNLVTENPSAKVAAETGSYFTKTSATKEDVKAAADNLVSRGLVKVPQAEKKPGEKESIFHRVAKFLVVIGVDEAAKILPHLTEEQIEKIVPEIATVHSVSPEEAEQVLAEFESLLVKARESGGVDTARTILTKAYGSQKAEDLIAKAVQFPQGKPFDYLEDASAERIGILLAGESASVQALVLSQIDAKKAAGVIKKMKAEEKAALALRIAKMKNVTPEVLERTSKALHEKLMSQNTENVQNLDGTGVLASILKKMDVKTGASIINSVMEEYPDVGEELRRRLFTEEDVLNCDDRYLQNTLQSMSNTELAMLLRGKNDRFREKMLKNVSKHRASEIKFEEETVDFIPNNECLKMTNMFYAQLRRAWEEGDLKVIGRDDDDEVYVQ